MSTSQCPSCHASVRADAEWCSRCHLDLRPKPAPVLVAVSERVVSRDPAVPGRGRHARSTAWPCVPCGAENDLDSPVCAACGSAFLAGPHSDGPTPLRLPIVGNLNRLGRPAIFGIAISVGLLGAALLSAVLALAGAVL